MQPPMDTKHLPTANCPPSTSHLAMPPYAILVYSSPILSSLILIFFPEAIRVTVTCT